MVRDYDIPIFSDDHVHFKDVLNQCVKNVFERNKQLYKPHHKIDRQLNRKWQKKYKLNKNKKEVKLEMVDLFLVGRVLLRKLNIVRERIQKRNEEKKLNEQASNDIPESSQSIHVPIGPDVIFITKKNKNLKKSKAKNKVLKLHTRSSTAMELVTKNEENSSSP